MAKDLKAEVKEKVEANKISDDIASFLYMIADNTLGDKNDKDAANELIKALFEQGFEIHDASGTKKIGSKVLQQALWRVMSKIKFLDVALHCTGKDENIERLVTEGVKTVMKRGALLTAFGAKAGVFMNAFLFGDGFLMFGKGENDDNPVSFRVLRNEDVYADNFSLGTRGVRPANKMAVIFQYDKDEAYQLWPELEENGVWGRIPGTYHTSTSKTDFLETDVCEICWGYNKAKKKHVVFAGNQCYELDKLEDEEYPFIKNNKAFIPVFQFMCQPSEDSFWNHGIGEMVYDLAVITAKLLNMEVGHLEENVYPITLINAPQSKVDELVEKMAMSNEARVQGGKPFVAMEFSASSGGGVQAQTLTTQNLFNEWSAVWDRLYRELARLGINLDDVDRGSGVTRGQVIAEEQASNAFILQMQEYNGEETEELIECVMDAITEFVSNKNKSPLNLLTTLMMPDGKGLKLDKDITMGMLSKELKDGNWFVVADVRSGAIMSDLTRMIKEEKLLAMEMPGSPGFEELKRKIAMRMGSDISVPMPMPQADQSQGIPQGGQPTGGPEEPMPTPMPTGNQRVLPEATGNLLQPV
jgi:hypothetical protein